VRLRKEVTMAAKPKKVAKKVASKKASKKVTSKARKAKPVAKAKMAARSAPKTAARKAAPKTARASSKAKPVAAAPQYHTVTPLLNVMGAESAIAFYKEAFGAKERVRMPGPDGKIMHAEIVIGDSVVMISDVMNQPATNSSLHVYVPDCDALYSRAVAAGATTKMALQDMFWGDRFGSVTDPFGNTWNIATHKEDISPEEMEKRMSEMPPPGSQASSTASA
jgi:PhnB protein